MGDVLADLVSWMSALPAGLMYAVILAIAYGENVLPPIPGDMIVVFGGYLAASGQLNIGVVILVSTIGGTAGFMTMYAIGSRVGHALMDPDRMRWLPKGKIARSGVYLSRWGFWLIAANRFLSGLRSVISLSVGMAHMNVGSTTVWATVSAVVWTALLAWAGWAIGENWEVVGVYLQRYGSVIGVLIVLFFGIQLGYYLLRRRATPGDGQPE